MLGLKLASQKPSVWQFSRSLSILSTLKPSDNSTGNKKRLGRGPSSGHGKTSGRGQKGQKARGSVKSWFEGGQTPIFKLFPKIGFHPVTSLRLTELNLRLIQKFHDAGKLNLEAGEVLTMAKMKELGLVTGSIGDGVKVLGNGKDRYTVPVAIEATRASKGAIECIKAAGGEFTAKYFNSLGLKAHLAPNWFLKKYGRVPLQARPTRRKDIDYYSSPNGYLTKEDNSLLKLKQSSPGTYRKIKSLTGGLETQLLLLDQSLQTPKQGTSGVISLSDL